MEVSLGEAQNTPKHKSGHSDKEWSLYQGSHSETWTSTLLVGGPPLQLPSLGPTLASPSADAASDWDFAPDACSAGFYRISSPSSLGVTCVGEVFPNKPIMVEGHRYVWVTPFGDAPLLRIAAKMGERKTDRIMAVQCRETTSWPHSAQCSP